MDRNEIIDFVKMGLGDAFLHLSGTASSKTLWTQTIKEKLSELGHKKGYKTSAKNVEGSDYGEWLFDLCWLDYLNNQKTITYLRSIPLIMESEWGNQGDIEDDFEKLMVARALVKVLVYNGTNAAVGIIPKRLIELISQFTQADFDDVYLLAAYTESGFIFHLLEAEKNNLFRSRALQ